MPVSIRRSIRTLLATAATHAATGAAVNTVRLTAVALSLYLAALGLAPLLAIAAAAARRYGRAP